MDTENIVAFLAGKAAGCGGGGGDITPEIKNAILACFENVAWANDDGLEYYNTLCEALGVTYLSSISAVYTQSGTVYNTDSLDSLKSDLVVTATYSDSSTAPVPSTDYTLSGTLAVGTSTITVSYGGKTDTFAVTVSPPSREMLFGAFSDGITVVKSNHMADSPYYESQTCTRKSTAARACAPLPIVNNNYVFTVTDSSKYNLVAYDVQDLTQISIKASVASQYYDAYAYLGGDKSIAWAATDSASTPYVWLVLKKMDGTAFTSEELADGAAAVFTYTES